MKKIFKIFYGLSLYSFFLVGFSLGSEVYNLYLGSKIRNSTFRVYIDNKPAATAVAISYNSHNYVLTNDHVCSFSDDGQVFLDYEMEPRKILYQSKETDLCLLSGNDTDNTLYVLDVMYQDMLVHVVGHAHYEEKSFRSGRVIGPRDINVSYGFIVNQLDYYNCIEMGGLPSGRGHCVKSHEYVDTTVNGGPGMSGSGVVNHLGFLVGIITTVDLTNSRMQYSPASNVIELIELYESMKGK